MKLELTKAVRVLPTPDTAAPNPSILHSGWDNVQTSKLCTHHSFLLGWKAPDDAHPSKNLGRADISGKPSLTRHQCNILLSLSLAVLTFSMSYQFLGKITFETLKVKATFDFTEGSSQSCIQSPRHSTYLHIQERTG